ncbi:MAG: LysR substrate-binding domain-containing protein [Pseudomonas sp.]
MKNAPPLKSLVYFEAAMRLNSFSMAGAELHVTPGAVGQQIRNLEQWLGVALFTRQIRQVLPTEDGLAYWARIQPALAQINNASQNLRERHSSSVWLTMPPGLAAKWFARRMSGFLQRHPEIALHLSSSVALVDFANERVDLAIRHFDGHAPELETHLLYRDEARLYCSPAYAARIGLNLPNDLQRATLLHSTLHPNWGEWLARFSDTAPEQMAGMAGIHFDQSLMAIEAARHDQGVVLTSPMLTEEEVGSGVLIEPFSQRLQLAKGFYLVQPIASTSRPAVQALKDWLIAEATQAPP